MEEASNSLTSKLSTCSRVRKLLKSTQGSISNLLKLSVLREWLAQLQTRLLICSRARTGRLTTCSPTSEVRASDLLTRAKWTLCTTSFPSRSNSTADWKVRTSMTASKKLWLLFRTRAKGAMPRSTTMSLSCSRLVKSCPIWSEKIAISSKKHSMSSTTISFPKTSLSTKSNQLSKYVNWQDKDNKAVLWATKSWASHQTTIRLNLRNLACQKETSLNFWTCSSMKIGKTTRLTTISLEDLVTISTLLTRVNQ